MIDWSNIGAREHRNMVQRCRQDAAQLRESNACGPPDAEVEEAARAYDALASAIERDELGRRQIVGPVGPVDCERTIAVIEIRQRPDGVCKATHTDVLLGERRMAEAPTKREAIDAVLRRVESR